MKKPTIIYTKTDEAPALATYSFLPIIRRIAEPVGVEVELRDISLAGRILAAFPDRLTDEQKTHDALAELGAMAETPEANIIKLPNISASVPQMQAAIEELRAKGFDLPDYPAQPSNEEEQAIRDSYDKVKGSAVNPVLRQGNSDRRAPKAVKAYARNHPPPMGAWSADSKSHVSTMDSGDFRHNEKSVTLEAATTVKIEHVAKDGTVTVLKDGINLEAGEVLDGTFMSRDALVSFLGAQIEEAKKQGVLFSLHMKATMMKVSDPIIFGHAVRVYFKDLFDKHGSTFDELGVNPNNGFGDVVAKIQSLPEDDRKAIEADIEAALESGPDMAMVNSHKGITNLHAPNDVIIDASMPPMIRTSGCMWNKDDKTQDTKAVIPDSSYAGMYQVMIDDCKKNGRYDPTTMGSVPNVGLMAKKAEEYGSHDKTFEIESEGTVRIVDAAANTLIEHEVGVGDIWRACQVKDDAIQDWVKLAVSRARATGALAIFWLDKTRAHDAQLITKVNTYLKDHDTSGLEFEILSPMEAMGLSVSRIREGKDTISVTGNVLRDYLTDLFPILEVGTSARMLSIVPLMKGGALFETGAGGSAPKHVQQFEKEGHLRWDSLGEFMALTESFAHIANRSDHAGAKIVSDALDSAVEQYLLQNKAPSRKVNERDNRGSQFYLTLFWAQALADQKEDSALAEKFAALAKSLAEAEEKIISELDAAQGAPVDIGGYFMPDEKLATEAMRPSSTFNALIDG